MSGHVFPRIQVPPTGVRITKPLHHDVRYLVKWRVGVSRSCDLRSSSGLNIPLARESEYSLAENCAEVGRLSLIRKLPCRASYGLLMFLEKLLSIDCMDICDASFVGFE